VDECLVRWPCQGILLSLLRRAAELSKKMIKRTLLMTSVALAAGCSAGGTSGEGTSVTTQPTTLPGNLMPGNSSPTVTPNAPNGGTGSPLFEAEEVEPTDDCDGIIPVTFRDFNNQTHSDFERSFPGDGVRLNLVAGTLGTDNKPVFASSLGCLAQQGTQTCRTDYNVNQAVITSAATFDQWYRDDATVNMTFERELELLPDPTTGLYEFSSSDFFPLTPTEGFGITPQGRNKNFLFTSEIHLTFTYVAGQRFAFRGDDDLWIFINKRLALDLGGTHGVEQGTIDFDAQAQELGIQPNTNYSMDIFHAERHTDASNFTIETNIACFTPAVLF
jgi:fibro-slime domain-containing protein